ncbi:3-dehydrosphinganine reductase TDEL_0D01840 [Torulaspora delbrueckii]|uniref:3-ketodihydrosphingosine reductase TSC10 n=1 Tax=Torulaspora delbrueckii TaxID=4950 RepID=G8ZT24_TORDE|nr:hypothetical protein TDEL_0D01840 [Torulaspora delbrueckii]CCE91768.1 hypothetical protein TDEL_0D01840 [Torulaspora delbrueckii]
MASIKYGLEDQVVLITGGSQGLGKQFAKKYYNESVRSKVVIVSRGVEKLRNAIQEVTDGEVSPRPLTKTDIWSGKDRIAYVPCDLSDYSSVSQLFEILKANDIVPTQFLACAGGSTPKLFKDLTGEQLEAGVKMNYFTALFLSHKVAQLYPYSHLILFSSETAFFPFIGYAQYAPSKEGIKALVSILRQELSHTRVSCVYPGNFESEGFALEELEKPAITKKIEGPSEPISCEECCNRIVRRLSQGYDDITVDLVGWFLMSTDMGLNKHDNYSFLWFLQLILGTLSNLFIVPIFMLMCRYDINKWHRNQKNPFQRK